MPQAEMSFSRGSKPAPRFKKRDTGVGYNGKSKQMQSESALELLPHMSVLFASGAIVQFNLKYPPTRHYRA